jgi:pimeloyl-ACP methyl ester carboxylesterase
VCVVIAVTVAAMGSAATATPAKAAAPTPCAATAAAEPQAGHTMPPQAPALFAPGFPALTDCEWGYPLGGWGGQHAGAALHHTPVIFVHGNQADAENWFLVADQFKAVAGYTDQEMYAISYNGLENGYAGLPTCCTPAPESQTYWQSTTPPLEAFCCNGGHGASDDPNVPDLYAFVHAVQAYTGSAQVDIVAHSLGVTITRRMLDEHPELRPDVLAAVMIAGANHGTTVCRGLATSYYGCDEIAPGTTWLDQINAAGEAPGPTHWMSVYNGTDNTDPFFQAVPGVSDDTKSPHLNGADFNVTCPMTYHNDLRVRPDIVQMYLDFLLRDGQAAALTTTNPPAVTAPSTCSLADQLPAQVPESPATLLLVTPALACAALVFRRRRPRSLRGTGSS